MRPDQFVERHVGRPRPHQFLVELLALAGLAGDARGDRPSGKAVARLSYVWSMPTTA
jgi:hypothetical protein